MINAGCNQIAARRQTWPTCHTLATHTHTVRHIRQKVDSNVCFEWKDWTRKRKTTDRETERESEREFKDDQRLSTSNGKLRRLPSMSQTRHSTEIKALTCSCSLSFSLCSIGNERERVGGEGRRRIVKRWRRRQICCCCCCCCFCCCCVCGCSRWADDEMMAQSLRVFVPLFCLNRRIVTS